MFDPLLLSSFLAVIDYGGFTEAGRRLHATQSTISGQIKRLEEQAGHRLLARSRGGGVSLTPQGKILAGYARDILNLQETARQRLAGYSLSGRVSLGLSDDFASGRGFVNVLSQFAHLHPDVLLEVEVGSGDKLIAAVADGRLDFALAKQYASGNGQWLGRREVVWVGTMRPGPLRLVVFPNPCVYRCLALAALQKADYPWIISYVSPSLAGIRAALAAGFGIAPLARDLVMDEQRILLPRDGLPELGCVDLVLHERPGLMNAAARRLGELLHTVCDLRPPQET